MSRTSRLAAIACAILCAHPLHAAEICFEPPLVRTGDLQCADSTVLVELVVRGAIENVQGFSITFRVDPEIMRPVRVLPGAALADQPGPIFFWPWENLFASGVIKIDVAVLGVTGSLPGADGSVCLAEIELAKQGCPGDRPCVTDLDLVEIDFRNGENRGIEVAAGASGSVEIEPCALPADPVSWGRIKMSYYR